MENLPEHTTNRNLLMLSMCRSAAAFETIFNELSAIEGGLRTLGDGADQPSVKRIREASRKIQKLIPEIAGDFARFGGWIAGRHGDPDDNIDLDISGMFRDQIKKWSQK